MKQSVTKLDEEMEKEAAQKRLQESVEPMFGVPAAFSNKVYATSSSLGIRLTFAERSLAEIDYPRSAVFLLLPDAVALKDLLERQLAQVLVSAEGDPDADS